MSSPHMFVLNWGIVGAGGISRKFAKDLALTTASRGISDVSHAIIAVGSRSKEKAEAFIASNCPEGGCAQRENLVTGKPEAKGNYAEVYGHPVSQEKLPIYRCLNLTLGC